MENRFTSLIEAHHDLLERGFDKNYNVITSHNMVDENGISYRPSQVSVDAFYRFEGSSNPDDNSIIYAIKTKDGSKGTLVSSYGSTGSRKFSEFILNIKDYKENTMIKKFKRAKNEFLEVIHKKDKVIIAAAAGLAIGTLIGFLLAPNKKNFSNKMVGKLKKLGDHGTCNKSELEDRLHDYQSKF